ncbi:3-oxoacyl-[acyl-carrier-protein] synthase I, chloroplastic-like [Actinidia eriantha]|uniref:3-oxoacyl-[acyl-carrier-protein] synthase I, chloroplastic-like n=1 Tax=Actinidia eriantha TaxID=165200 RepID=UPI002583DC99|nr:3-oxoacyl-[acyl-carrier-protein] synthase I, chloroplastic-like [Actinidia eriantha]
MAELAGGFFPSLKHTTMVLHSHGSRAVNSKNRPTEAIFSSRQKQRRVRAMASTTASAPKREKDPRKRIVITGMGLVSVLGNDVNTFYDKLLDGESGISLIDKFDASDYPVQIAGQIRDFSTEGFIDQSRYQNLDECWKFSLFAAKKALQDANLGPQVLKTLDISKMGVVVGSGAGGIKTLCNAVDALLKQDYSKILTSYYPNNLGPALLAIETGFMGPIYSISTACASANYSLYAAANHIRRGEAEVMVAGGTDAGVIPSGICGFMACKALSSRNKEPHTASRPWDKGRDGFVLSEGSGVLVLESLDHATKRGARIIAEYLGGAITCDAHHLTDPRADGSGVAACIYKGLQNAGVSPEEVNYVNAHATSTRVGDLAEVNAIKTVFKNQHEMKMNGTKSMIGHAIGAAGALEAIATVKAIATGWLHPTINQYNLEPEVTIDTIPNTKIKHDINVAISNSFGFGGHNSVVVFAPFTP